MPQMIEFSILPIVMLFGISEAWMMKHHDSVGSHRHTTSYSSLAITMTVPKSSCLFGIGVETISLKVDDNHEEEGTLMAESIVRWLDSEWMPQQVHIDMAESAKRSYIRCRESDNHDVMDVMMQVSTDLEKNWTDYDDTSFVSAWDVGNYVADYLTKRSGNEGCECSSPIF